MGISGKQSKKASSLGGNKMGSPEYSFVGRIKDEITEHMNVINALAVTQSEQISEMALMMLEAIKNGKKIFFMGNGGSAGDAQHLAAELVGRFKAERRALPAIALTTDTSILTALANDYGYEFVFSRQIEALANSGDVVIGISTSGQSPNVVKGIQTAEGMGCKTIGFTGRDGGKVAKLVDLSLIVPSAETSRIQEAHIMIGHILCGLIEQSIVTG